MQKPVPRHSAGKSLSYLVPPPNQRNTLLPATSSYPSHRPGGRLELLREFWEATERGVHEEEDAQ